MAGKLAATFGPHVDEYAVVREINANLPFADPIALGYEWRDGNYFTFEAGSYRDHDRRRRALARLAEDF